MFLPGHFYLVCAALLAAVFLIVAALRIATRDIWMDEAWSLFLSDPSPSLRALIGQRLVYDVHPPLFNIVAHFARGWLPEGVFAARMINVLVLLPVIGYVARTWMRDRAFRPVLATFAVTYTAGIFVVHYVAEFRSYYSVLMVCACYAIASLRVMVAWLRGGSADKGDAAVLFASAALLMHLQLFSAIFVAIHGGLLLIALGLHRRWRQALSYAAWLTVFGLLLVVWYLRFADLSLGAGAGGSWIPAAGPLASIRRTMSYLLLSTPNPVLWLLAFVMVVHLLWRLRAPSRLPASPSGSPHPDTGVRGRSIAPEDLLEPAGRSHASATAAAIVLFVSMTLVVNLFTPFIVDRYFTPVAGPLALLLSFVALAGLARSPAGLRTVTGCAILLCSAGAFAFDYLTEARRWNTGMYLQDSAREAVELNRGCDQPVRYLTSNRLRYAINQEIALNWGADEIARQLHFSARMAREGETIAVDARCPLVAWVLHIHGRTDDHTVQEILDEHRLKVIGAQPQELELDSYGANGVIRLRPGVGAGAGAGVGAGAGAGAGSGADSGADSGAGARSGRSADQAAGPVLSGGGLR
ncbi:MAG: hypothetical protein QM766_23785 [Burkholderiaceae bacterium]